MPRVTHSKTTPTIGQADWNADHVLEDVAPATHTHDYADPDHLHPHSHPENADAVHSHSYADPNHSHDTTHSHTAADVGAAETAHTHDTTHDHSGEYAAPHSHPYAATAHAHDYADPAHTHDTSHTHDLTAYATDADLVAHAATPHGGEGGGVPAGVIVMWGGNVNQIPSGWNLCDGTNGTPNLTDRFIKGGSPGSTGGASTHSHAAHTGVISHTHSVAVTDPGHDHVENSNNATTGPLRGWPTPDTSTNTSMATGYSTASATTGISASASAPAGAVNELTHDSVSNEPPYYTLAFIQKA